MRRITQAVLDIWLLVAIPVFAEIITERNDCFEGLGCYTPQPYKFIGTDNDPGITSQWIPYGTYTHGTGGVEYTRVTSNLMGVVASAIGGLAEREHDGYYPLAYILRQIGMPTYSGYWTDSGESATNLSLRIADQLNLPLIRVYFSPSSGEYEYDVYYCLEPLLVNVARSHGFGSRILDLLSGNSQPPISSTWSPDIPFKIGDVESWRNVYPTFERCAYDDYLFTDGSAHYPVLPGGRAEYDSVWGQDTVAGHTNLVNALCDMPLNVSIEDVLSYDTGFSTNVYCHWNNGTTRLDWKRLGIICQLERQMELTYEGFPVTDELPIWQLSASSFQSSVTEVEIPLPEASYNGQVVGPITNCLQGAVWTRDDERYNSETNSLEWGSPICNTHIPSIITGVSVHNPYRITVGFDTEQSLEMMLETLCRSVTNDFFGEIEFWGHWTAGSGLGIEFSNFDYHGTEHAESNIVSVAASNGFRARSSSLDHLKTNWDLGDDTTSCIVQFSYIEDNPVTAYIKLMPYDYSYGVEYDVDIASGHEVNVTTPSVGLLSTGPESATNNWVWSVSGLPNVSTNCVFEEQPDYYIWYLGDYMPSFGDGGYVAWWKYRDCMEVYLQCETDIGHLVYYQDSPQSRSWNSITVNLVLRRVAYEREFGGSGQLPASYTIAADYGVSSNVYSVIASMYKQSGASFTQESPEAMEETMGRFDYFGSTQDWSRIYSIRRSELELLHGVTDTTNETRLFRMLQGSDEPSFRGYQISRYNMLVDLSNACKSRCQQLGGMSVANIEDFGKISQSKYMDMLSSLDNANVFATYTLTSFYEESLFHISGNVSKRDGSIVVKSLYDPPAPCAIGSGGWAMSVSTTNRVDYDTYKEVLVDGYQAPVRKTLWKFKNLRDPNLR